ncbi:MAG: nitroreductase family protein [Planctomycetota bacterium]|jgi:nitroreductase
MELLDLMKKRCSVRKYSDKSIEKEKLLAVLEAGRIAPSACNNQPWSFIVLENEDLKNKVSANWGEKAPVIIAICGNHNTSWKRGDGKDSCDIDIAIAIDHMTLAATEIGLGTCWVCSFDAKSAKKTLDLPDNIEVIALLPIGYPEEQSSPDRHSEMRKSLDEIVEWK